ncbi:hypothetical protein [Pseudomonas aeruginosa]|uniref:Ead/Ea22-like family protein n=1 Tax=Pseudomonas phage PMG1 TaxID=2992927 RepID=H2BDF0_9CAUD|nr:hypothetical protein [Pseudomonas aeruginosa]YP_005098249.1 hypothetical protein PMG1_00046 [Pseudomonas phage PMG1]AEX55917.1 hypothetical protein PMG1_00046 [Pseudomonas phage PMG1]MDI4210592.1 hypothetical protein [Pseudomonas aeruginosa]
MSEVKRFDHVNHAHVDDCEHIENPEGAWVKASDYDALAAEAQALREEVAALRARVVVLPDASTVYAALDARERLFTSPENIQVALEAQSRLNGKTVSEGLLRKWLELMEHGDYREGHCMCGSPVDSHGIGDGHAPIDAGEYYAGQVMEELRALLNQDKENGNG